MAKFNSIQNTFVNGQISKKFRGRSNLQEYANSAEIVENFIPLKEGGVTRRPGTRFIEDAPTFERHPSMVTYGFTRSMLWGSADVDTTNDTISGQSSAAHVFVTGDAVEVSNPSGSLPAELSTSTTYYIIRVDADTVQLATSLANALAGTAIDLTTAGSGVSKEIFFAPDTYKDLTGSRLIPFVVNKTEAYSLLLDFSSFPHFVIFRNDGNERLIRHGENWGHINADPNNVGTVFPRFRPNLDNYRLQYAQSGDVMYFTYNDDDTDEAMKPFVIFRVPVEMDFVDGDVSAANDDITFSDGFGTNYIHTFIQGDEVILVSTGTLPTGTTAFQKYYVIVSDENTIQLAASADDAANGVAVDITAASGGGTHTIRSLTSSDFFLDDMLEPSLTNAPRLNAVSLEEGLRVPYIDRNISTTTFAPAATSGASVSLVASTTYFTRRMLRSFVKIVHGSTEGLAQITSISSTAEPVTTCTISIIVAFGATSASDNWTISAWNAEFGFPKTISLFESRLLMGGTRRDPDTVWGSKVNNKFHFMEERLVQDKPTDQEDGDSASDTSGLNHFGFPSAQDPFSMTVESTEINAIQWLASAQDLQIGTLGSEYIANGGQENILHPGFNVFKRQQTRHGSSFVQAHKLGNTTVFVTRDGKTLRQFYYDDARRSYVSPEITALFDGITEHKFDSDSTFNGVQVVDFAYQESRKTLWVLTDRNTVMGYTYDPEFGIKAWHVHDFGGSNGSDIVKVHGICSIPSPDGTYDDLWLTIERTVNSSTVTYLEKIGDIFEHTLLDNSSTNDDDYPWFMDSAIRVTAGSPTTSFSGFDHLEGETLKVIADGILHADVTVSSGAITLTRNASTVIAGLSYTSTLKTFPIEAGGQFGTSQGEIKRIDKIFLKFFKSYGGKSGKDEDNLRSLEYDDPTDTDNDPLTLLTGDKDIDHTASPDEEAAVAVVQDQPLPMTLLAIVYKGVTYSG